MLCKSVPAMLIIGLLHIKKNEEITFSNSSMSSYCLNQKPKYGFGRLVMPGSPHESVSMGFFWSVLFPDD